ncbi:MAG: hypothetical protein ACI9UV_002802, partial [Algoriphagus sp.]
MKSILILLLFYIGAFFQSEKVVEVKILRSEFVYESAPFPECHASTLVET